MGNTGNQEIMHMMENRDRCRTSLLQVDSPDSIMYHSSRMKFAKETEGNETI